MCVCGVIFLCVWCDFFCACACAAPRTHPRAPVSRQEAREQASAPPALRVQPRPFHRQLLQRTIITGRFIVHEFQQPYKLHVYFSWRGYICIHRPWNTSREMFLRTSLNQDDRSKISQKSSLKLPMNKRSKAIQPKIGNPQFSHRNLFDKNLLFAFSDAMIASGRIWLWYNYFILPSPACYEWLITPDNVRSPARTAPTDTWNLTLHLGAPSISHRLAWCLG